MSPRFPTELAIIEPSLILKVRRLLFYELVIEKIFTESFEGTANSGIVATSPISPNSGMVATSPISPEN
jgi:hypothetical protein